MVTELDSEPVEADQRVNADTAGNTFSLSKSDVSFLNRLDSGKDLMAAFPDGQGLLAQLNDSDAPKAGKSKGEPSLGINEDSILEPEAEKPGEFPVGRDMEDTLKANKREPIDQKRLGELTDQLDDNSYKKRAGAQSEIEKTGPDALSHIDKALSKPKSLEQSERLRSARENIYRRAETITDSSGRLTELKVADSSDYSMKFKYEGERLDEVTLRNAALDVKFTRQNNGSFKPDDNNSWLPSGKLEFTKDGVNVRGESGQRTILMPELKDSEAYKKLVSSMRTH